jgi:two-component system KDP operon response regulator KdpE
MSTEVTVLLVEDEPHIRRVLQSVLATEGYRVFEAETGERGLVEASTRRPDLLVVDLGLPDMDGVEVVRAVRHWSEVPILVLSARAEEADKIAALDEGADDYLTKPFGVGELLARVRALVRRRAKGGEGTPVVSFGEVRVDLVRRAVTRNGELVHLTNIEYRLLAVLVANAGKVMTHQHLMREVWGPGHTENSHYLRIYVSRLRQKLEPNPTEPAHLLTESGVGYRFVA